LTNRETIELFDAEVVASEAALSRSKNIEKSAKEELEQHRRWLQRHDAADARNREKHQRRLKQLRISQRRWVKRQRLLRSLKQQALIVGATAKRQALIVGAVARSVAITSGQKAASAAKYARDQISAAVTWSRPRLQAAATASYRAGNAGYAWLKVKAIDAGLQTSKGSKIAAARGQALARELSKKGATGIAMLSVKARHLALQLSQQSSAAFEWSRTTINAGFAWSRTKADVALAWSGTKAGVLSRSASHTASIGFEQAKRKSGKFAQSASALTAATAVRARDYGHQAVASAKSLSEKAGEGAQQLRESLAARTAVSQPQTSPVPRPALAEPPVAAQEPAQRSVIDLLNIAPQRATPAEAEDEPVSAPVDVQPKALALTKPSPPRYRSKPDKVEAKDKTRRGGRGGKKKHKQKRVKSKSK
jgi:hypothetical protein